MSKVNDRIKPDGLGRTMGIQFAGPLRAAVNALVAAANRLDKSFSPSDTVTKFRAHPQRLDLHLSHALWLTQCLQSRCTTSSGMVSSLLGITPRRGSSSPSIGARVPRHPHPSRRHVWYVRGLWYNQIPEEVPHGYLPQAIPRLLYRCLTGLRRECFIARLFTIAQCNAVTMALNVACLDNRGGRLGRAQEARANITGEGLPLSLFCVERHRDGLCIEWNLLAQA
ncbi:hypothetical protein BDR05DRAFT_997732 [Suillus weaverae]|nr:hypothetical protein BDR05DRAFT_997732 [Suillus weaverae]